MFNIHALLSVIKSRKINRFPQPPLEKKLDPPLCDVLHGYAVGTIGKGAEQGTIDQNTIRATADFANSL